MNEPLVSLIIASGIIVISLIIFLPDNGLISRFKNYRLMSERVIREDSLKNIQKLALQNKFPSLQSVAGALGVSLDKAANILEELEKQLEDASIDKRGA